MGISRRGFLAGAAAGVAALSLPAAKWLNAAREDKLRIAVVGTANQAAWNIEQIRGEQIAAICDVDAHYLEACGKQFPDAKRFRDFREMLTASLDLDAVLVAAPDHIHAPAAALGLRQGLHVYCEKPLAHTVEESRTLARLAIERQRVTQMGTQIHAGANYRRVVELIRSGAIGAVREVHVWCGKTWSNGKYAAPSPAPAHLDWNLWQGPAPEHEFSADIHPMNWRRFWAYGTGTLGDMACHYLDLVHWALDLRQPQTVEATGPAVDAIGTPEWLIARFDHGARGAYGPVTVTWYDGGKRPELLKTLKNKDGSALAWGDGHLFVGADGLVISDYNKHLLLRGDTVADFKAPTPTIPDSIGHHAEWIRACKAGDRATTCNFGYSGALTETVLLGNVAYRVGKRLEWDPGKLKATNAPEADQYLRAVYRSGWTL
ncbi:MAG: Gfo/Idh/MocA family protein [Planctomycetota bacterium]